MLDHLALKIRFKHLKAHTGRFSPDISDVGVNVSEKDGWVGLLFVEESSEFLYSIKLI